MDIELAKSFIGQANGMVLVALLLVILLCLLIKKRTEKLPSFCDSCANMKQRLFSSATFCNMRCKYNPLYRHTSGRSYYVRNKR
ncbi:MAG: hypothetical protein V3S46_00970 [Nitrospinota bacterium]